MPRDLFPIAFPALIDRLDRELKVADGPVYSARPRDIWVADPDVDLSVQHMAGRIGNALGPASGPHTQMAQNIVLAYLCGSRFMELKTVQILDELEIPRPCIFVPNIGFNVEWSQELRVHESAREYVAAWYLLHGLRSELGPAHLRGPSGDFLFDLSIGYGLEGIQGEKVTGFVRSLQDNAAIVEELRAEIAESHPAWAELEVPKTVVTSTTLSTFHGCPADEIEGIAAHTLEAFGLHTVIKLNPTLLGYDVVREMLDKMGYGHIVLREKDFDADLQWDQLMDFLPRLEAKAKELGLGLGVKFSNTLVCENPDTPFTDDEMYMSGQPLHVLALTLADKFRQATNGRFDISFSAGVDPNNFWKLAGAGLKPVTTCSDILKGQGYARLPKYLQRLEREMKKAGAKSMDEYSLDLEALAAEARDDVEYTFAQNKKAPRKVGSSLHLFDCLTCDKCLKVCPNLANVVVDVEQGEWDLGGVSWTNGALQSVEGPKLVVKEKHQIGNVVDLCNECGQCDPWCPEDGGPYIEKPHLFLAREAFEERSHLPGFLLEGGGLIWRNDRGVFRYLPQDDGTARLEMDGGAIVLRGDEVVSAEGSGEVALRVAVTMRLLLAGFTADGRDLFT